MGRKLQGLRLVGGPVDDIGPYDFNILESELIIEEEKKNLQRRKRIPDSFSAQEELR